MSSETNAEPHADHLSSLQDAVDHLEAVAYVPPKQRHINVSELSKIIVSHAYEKGIPIDILHRLVDIITKPNHLDQVTTSSLIKNLYALEKIPSDILTKVICCLGPTKAKPSPGTQALLLRWLILVYEYLEDPSHLSKLYSVLFNCLDMISLRRSLCHLLSLITRRKHVKPFRIQALMELMRNVGDEEKELMNFLRVFKNYYPEIIVTDLGGSKRTSFFRHPDLEWSNHLKRLQEMNQVKVSASIASTFQVVHRGGVKRSKIESLIPDVQTSRVQPDQTSLEELRNVNDFVEKLEKIELPNQLISTLGDPLAQKYFLLVDSETATCRLENWLESFLRDELERAQQDEAEESEALGYTLLVAVGYVRHTKRLPTAILSFIKSYLLSWDGKEHKNQILGLLEYLPLGAYDSLRKEFLDPLEYAILNHTSSRAVVTDFYASLIRQWGVTIRTLPSITNPEGYTPLLSLITHAELFSLSALEFHLTANDGDSSSLKPICLSVLQLYATLADLFTYAAGNGNIRITLPLTQTIYNFAFTSTIAHLSLLCSVLAAYKSSFEASLVSQDLQASNPLGFLYPPQMVGQFNGYVMDLCNLLWRNRGFNTDDPNALACLVPAPTVKALMEYSSYINEMKRSRRWTDGLHYYFPAIFSLSQHIALCNNSAACFADLEDELLNDDQVRLEKPVTQKALTALEKDGGVKITWQEYRLKMLDWMDEMGCQGIGKLMKSTMKALRKEG